MRFLGKGASSVRPPLANRSPLRGKRRTPPQRDYAAKGTGTGTAYRKYRTYGRGGLELPWGMRAFRRRAPEPPAPLGPPCGTLDSPAAAQELQHDQARDRSVETRCRADRQPKLLLCNFTHGDADSDVGNPERTVGCIYDWPHMGVPIGVRIGQYFRRAASDSVGRKSCQSPRLGSTESVPVRYDPSNILFHRDFRLMPAAQLFLRECLLQRVHEQADLGGMNREGAYTQISIAR